MAEALTLIRVASIWDQAAIRQQLHDLPQAISARAADGVIYQGRNTLTRLTIAGREVVAKAFPAPRTILKRVQRIGRESKAVRAFDHAQRMQQLGIGTPEPLAAIEAEDGRGWYLCAWADGCSTFRHVSRQNDPQHTQVCAALGTFIGHMHHVGAYHFDSTPGNLLYRPEQQPLEFLVVDCNRMRFGHIGIWDGVGTLAQLDQHGRLLDSYCAARGWQVARIRWWYRMRLTIERGSRALKNSTRPLRRKIGV